MSYASTSAGGEFRIGNVLNRAFQICAANFPFFFIITLIIALPNLLLAQTQTPGQVPQLSAILPMLGVSIVLGLVLNTIGEAILLYAAFQWLRGHSVQAGEAIQRALSRFLPLLGLGLLYGIAVAFGMLLLIVPGFILLVMWAVVVPACVVEGLGPIESMSRSSALTKGYRWQIFGILLLVGFVNWIGSLILGFVLAPTGVMVAIIGKLVWTAVWATYWNSVLIMIYHDLRVAKEGIDTHQIAAVFD